VILSDIVKIIIDYTTVTMIYTRLLIPTATWQRRCIKLLPSFSSSTTNNVLMCNTQTQRSFATQKKKKNKGSNKPQDVYKQQIKAQQQQSSSIIGKRPGQTSFSPPTEKIVLEANTSTHQSLSTPSKIKSTSAHIKHTHMPLIIPPSIQSSIANQPLSSSSSSTYTDNKNVAHTQPSISKYTQELIDKEDSILRQQFLREGILPPPDRPNIIKSSTTTTDKQSTNNITPVEIPEAHPSGVSHANPEDILDMASMYDPSIHLPDKPNFNSPTNRIKYEAGTPLTDELIAYIGVRGPITVAEYMRRVLRDGRYGYYTSKGSRSGQKMNSGSATAVGAVGDNVEDDIDDDNDWDLDDGNDPSSSDEQVGGGEQVIGPSGDFITAPEVSQLFGESLLVWLMTQYQTLNNPSKIQIIEIGPGKGTLICDIVRSAISTFPDFASALSSSTSSTAKSNDEYKSGQENKKVAIGVHLVEVANGMRSRQRESLQHLENEKLIVDKGCSFQFSDSSLDDDTEDSDANSSSSNKSDSSSIETGKEEQSTICFSWHDVLSSVPTHNSVTGEPIPTFIICQELVDALPVHSFQKIEGNVWRERLVDVVIRDEKEASDAANDIRSAVTKRFASAEEPNDAVSSKPTLDSSTTEDNNNKKLPRLRFVLPPDTTPALRSMLRVDNRGSPTEDNPSAQTLNSLPVGSIIEACPEGLVLAQDIADRIEKCNGGAALIIDYGGDGSSGGDTLRGFWKHTQVHPLSRPGEIDVTADVDFGALREAVNQRMSLVDSIKRKQRQEGKKSNFEDDAAVDQPSDETNQHKPEAFGPITQGNFLAQMGIVQRVEKKIEDPETTDDQAYEIYSAMEWLMVPEQMGERFKVLAIAQKKQGLFPPPGF